MEQLKIQSSKSVRRLNTSGTVQKLQN